MQRCGFSPPIPPFGALAMEKKASFDPFLIFTSWGIGVISLPWKGIAT